MTDVGVVDLDAMWASLPRDAVDRMASFACKLLDASAAILSSFDGDRCLVRGTSGTVTGRDARTEVDAMGRDLFASGAMSSMRASAGNSYLCVPVRLSIGRVLGTLCVIGVAPRDWTDDDIATLGELAQGFSARLALGLELGLRETAAAALVNINHELRTPLQAIIGFTEFLKIETRPEVIAAHAQTIQTAAQLLLALVNQTLDIAESDAETSEGEEPATALDSLGLRTFAATCLSMVEPAAIAKALATRLVIEADVPEHVPLDGQKTQQALLNLLNNAVKFTDAGCVTLHIGLDAGRLRFGVSDTGIGIDPDKRGLLFQRFSRIEADDRPTDGTGLGLSITKDLVESMAGDIGVEANAAGGSTFWFALPLDTAPAAVVTAPDPEITSSRRGAMILLADDLDLNRKLIADMLGLDGHRVDCVADGAAAVAAVTAKSYDLVLMDMIMPVMDGLAATRAIRALPAPHCKVPIVALTAHSFREQLDACLAAGMDATLTKPMSIDALIRAVDTWTRDRVEAA